MSRFLIFLSGQIPHLPLVPSGALPGTAQPPPTSPAITAATAAAFQTRPPAVPSSGTANTPGQPQQMITAGTKKDCIRLRGLPYEAQVEHILEFLGKDLSNNIVTQGVHMVINSQVIPKVIFPSPSFYIPSRMMRWNHILSIWVNFFCNCHQMSVVTLVSRPTSKIEVLATEFKNQGEQISCHRLSSCMVLQQCGYFDVSSNHRAVLISCQRLSSWMILRQPEFYDVL